MSSHIYGFDTTNHQWEPVGLDTNGKLKVDATISTAGLATDSLQTAGNSTLSSLNGKVTACDTANIAGAVTVSNTVSVDNSGVTQPVSASSLPLPTGAASESSLAALNGKVTACDTANIAGAVTVSNTVAVDGSGVTQPVSGTFFQATQPVSASSLPLPTGAATQTTLASMLADTGSLAACNNGANALQVDIQADATGIASQSLQTAGNSSLTSVDAKMSELSDNGFVSESVVVAASSLGNTSTTIDCTQHSKLEVICSGSLVTSNTHVQLQWSDDNSNWYAPNSYQTLQNANDADGTTGLGHQAVIKSDVSAKYARVRIYNPSSTVSDTVKVMSARVH